MSVPVPRLPSDRPRALHRELLRTVQLQHRSMHRLLTLVREMDACAAHRDLGCVTLRQYLELACGITAVAARERVRVARALGELGATDAAMERGELSYSKVRAITRVATTDTEHEWIERARSATADELDTLVARSQNGKPRERRLLSYAIDRHTTRMVVELPAEEMELVLRAIDRIRKEAGGKLPASQALVCLAADSLAGEVRDVSTGDHYTVVVHADKEGTAWVETEGGNAPLRPQVVERLLCDCSMRLAREESDGGETLSRRHRTIPTVTRRSIELRDRKRCRVPGCSNRLWLEAHHRLPRSQGGRHTRCNLILLCTQHHQLCHDGALIIEFDARGDTVFRAANGWILGADGAMWVDRLWDTTDASGASAEATPERALRLGNSGASAEADQALRLGNSGASAEATLNGSSQMRNPGASAEVPTDVDAAAYR